jgi:dihydrofolate reductase
MINLIIATDSNWGIGKDNDLLYHLSADLKRFKTITSGKTIVMGRKTWESLPKKLPNRTHVVISSEPELSNDPDYVFGAVEPVLKMAETEDMWVIGGAAIAKLFLPYLDRIELTLIKSDDVDADTRIEFLEEALATSYICVGSEDGVDTCKKSGKQLEYSFLTYAKK